ncbi:MAG: exodeoxyribonuclease VII small subunit [Clostridia bacterium]|mgnify:CR=1 FL=1|jgi:exodeoxyribonuclease VII small subunit|nr:exodeoxyribonuclease VII small subunit [Clostridia bacterium]MDD4572257.1 exodeoxyribonuclease VII small subunit [Clostridia bacterium]
MMAKKIKNFAENINELENIIAKMEDGELSLEEMLSQYAKGVEILAICRTQLQEAETKIQAVKGSGENDD